MRKSKVLFGAATFLLTLGGLSVTKANKKFTHVSSGRFISVFGGNIANVYNLTRGFDIVKVNSFNATVVMATTGLAKVLGTLFIGTYRGTDKLIFHN
ncbi:MAG TPA: hypothetical protein VNX68_04065 [Nitrosopumilaceae archaeon]|jgi:hypothetical protein|nr:hypothetical protein [Nitrosopumilaceae archaeon]